MEKIIVRRYLKWEETQIRDFVLGIQNGEFGLGFLPEEQPDLLDLNKFYSSGGFWIATAEAKIYGTIGFQKIDDRNGVLRKMFVAKDFRGSEVGIAQKLFDKLKEFALETGMEFVFLDTPSIAVASHRFYVRNGFIELPIGSTLPKGYSYPDRNSKIFMLKL
ncbi:GNAT family N-acetyltransferase [Pedobacter jamesrossensis]|uniref:GNAT family N-acetyltransferase n=1 Tax=Pedobacter jamesrossensis TaxID=1908238 RepID=A0ABV8NHZ3_9SPHI